jgi:hypothetical protein
MVASKDLYIQIDFVCSNGFGDGHGVVNWSPNLLLNELMIISVFFATITRKYGV